MAIDLDELERLAKAALFLPWKVTKDLEKWRGARYEIETWKGRHVGNVCNGNAKDDAAYIVAACNSLPTIIAENRALRERVRELEELCGNLNREVVNLLGSFPVTDCRTCDYSYWCTREKTQIDPDFDMCKAAILEFCKPDSEEAGE